MAEAEGHEVAEPAVAQFIFNLMVEGYTIPAIVTRLEKQFPDAAVPYAELVGMYQDRYQQITEERALREKHFKESGLGSRVGRAARLAKHVEQLETYALRSPAFARAYTDALAKLDAVLTPEERSRLPQDDEWVQLLNRLMQLPKPSLVPPDSSLTIQSGLTRSESDQVESSSSTWSEG